MGRSSHRRCQHAPAGQCPNRRGQPPHGTWDVADCSGGHGPQFPQPAHGLGSGPPAPGPMGPAGTPTALGVPTAPQVTQKETEARPSPPHRLKAPQAKPNLLNPQLNTSRQPRSLQGLRQSCAPTRVPSALEPSAAPALKGYRGPALPLGLALGAGQRVGLALQPP